MTFDDDDEFDAPVLELPTWDGAPESALHVAVQMFEPIGQDTRPEERQTRVLDIMHAADQLVVWMKRARSKWSTDRPSGLVTFSVREAQGRDGGDNGTTTRTRSS